MSESAPKNDFSKIPSWLIVVAAVVAGIPAAAMGTLLLRSALAAIWPSASLSSLRGSALVRSGEAAPVEWFFPLALVILLALILVGASRYTAWLRAHTNAFLALLVLAGVAAIFLAPAVLRDGSPLIEPVDSPLLLALLLQVPVVAFAVGAGRRQASASLPAGDQVTWLAMASSLGLAALGGHVLIRYVVRSSPTAASLLGLTGIAVIALFLPWTIGWLAARIPSDRDKKRLLAASLTASGTLSLALLLPPLMAGAAPNTDQAVLVPGIFLRSWVLALLGLAAVLAIEAGFRLSRARRLRDVVPSVWLAALVIPLRANYGIPTVPSDDYHFGENFSPWFLWIHGGQAPYTDIALPRGILPNIAPQAVNATLSGGAATTWGYSTLLVGVVVLAVAHALLRRSIGLGWASGIVLLLGVGNFYSYYFEGDLLIGALLVWGLSVALKGRRPLLTGAAAGFCVAAAILAYPLAGLAVALCLIWVSTIGVLGVLIARQPASLLMLGRGVLGVALALGLVVLSPLRASLIAAIEQTVANASTSKEAFGIPTAEWLRRAFGLGEILAVGFAASLPVAAWFAWRARSLVRKPGWTNYVRFAVILLPAVWTLVMVGRYTGRIDLGPWSFRPVAGSLLVIGLLIPASLILVRAQGRRGVLVGCVVTAVILSAALFPLGKGSLMRSSLGLVTAPTVWRTADLAAQHPSIGIGEADPTHLAFLSQIAAASAAVKPETPVLNLSNRGAFFAYFAWRDPMRYLAPYNIESAEAEASMVAKLRADVPSLALIGPGDNFDGGPLALRAPTLAKWVMKTYQPAQCGESLWGVPLGRSGQAMLQGDCRVPASRQDSMILWSQSIGAGQELGMLPSTWGRDATHGLARSRHRGAEFRGLTSGIPAQLARPYAIAEPFDLLRLVATCPSNPDALPASPRNAATYGATGAVVRWADPAPAGAVSESWFQWGAGTFIVPLDAYPSWLLMRPSALVLTVSDVDCPGGWTVESDFLSRSSG